MNTTLTLASAFPAERWRGAPEAQPSQRILLHADELYRIPATCRWLRPVQGIAYLSQAGQDVVARPGESIRLARAKDVALVSLLRGETLVIELFE